MAIDNSSADKAKMSNPPLLSPYPPDETGYPPVGLENRNPDQRHFDTAHLLNNLKGRTVSSGFITILAQGVQFVLNLAAVMVLARLLTPQDFGLVAMVITITNFLRIFNDAGLSTATVQRDGITHAQVSNLFWINVVLGGSISLILAVSAPAVAWFYREPRLVGVTLTLCITFLLTSSAVQHLALLKRQMRFKMIAFIQIGSVLAGVAVGITMAALKCGYWSLVWMQVTTSAVAFLLTWSTSRWRPQLFKRRSGTRPLIQFGANLTVSSLFWSLAKGSDGVLIGRFYGSAPLGVYSRAGALINRPIEQLMTPIEAVFVPTLARLLAQPDRYRRIVLQVYDLIAVTSFPLAAMFLVLAHPLMLVVLGPKWEKAAPIFASFTWVALYTPVASVSGWLITSQGRGRDYLILSSISSFLAVASFLVGLPFGPVGMARSYAAYCLLAALPLVYYGAGRRGPVTTRDLWIHFFKHVPLWCLVYGTTWLARRFLLQSPPLIQLLVCGSAGLLVAVAYIWIQSPSHQAVVVLFDAVREWKKSRPRSAA